MQTPRKSKKQVTRQKILNASYELFHENGYDDTSYTDIAKRASVGYGTVYSHFPNKKSLLVDQTFHLLKQQYIALKDKPQEGRSHLEHAFHLINLSWSMAMSLPSRLRSVYMAHRWTGEAKEYAFGNDMRDKLLGVIGEHLIKAQENGEICKDINIPMHLVIMDAAYIKAVQAGRFGEDEQAFAQIEFNKQLKYLLRL